MSGRTSLVDLLALLLDLPPGLPVHATPNFAPWLPPHAVSRPPHPGAGGLWLIDTRDRLFRRPRQLEHLLTRAGFDAALIVASRRGPAARRLADWLRPSRCPRAAGARVQRVLDRVGPGLVQVMQYEEGCHAPTDFELAGAAADGVAFLVTRRRPFDGPFWSWLAQAFGSPSLELDWFDLRDRGAAVLSVNAGGRSCVVRVVPDPAMQEVVRRNHQVLAALRAAVQEREIATLVPEPVLMESRGATLVMAEARLPGVLAWKAASGALAPVIRAAALSFLDALHGATARSTPLSPDEIEHLLRADRTRVERAGFVADAVRRYLAAELAGAAAPLSAATLRPVLSHGDYGYGNILVDPRSGELRGVIDWDTARADDVPGIDRLNLELQLARTAQGSFASAVRSVWARGVVREALANAGDAREARAVFGLAVCRYVARSFAYPSIYRQEADDFEAALAALSGMA